MHGFSISTHTRTEFINVTDQVQHAVDEQDVKHGLVTVFVPHTTAGITINENADPDVLFDMATALEEMVPWNSGYRHNEGNSAAHVKASMMGSSVQIIIESGHLQLGTWQSIFFCEFDGPRTRKILVKTHK